MWKDSKKVNKITQKFIKFNKLTNYKKSIESNSYLQLRLLDNTNSFHVPTSNQRPNLYTSKEPRNRFHQPI